MIADVADGVIQPMDCLADPFPSQLNRLACGRVQAEPDVEQLPTTRSSSSSACCACSASTERTKSIMSSWARSCVASLTTARTKCPLAVGTGLSVIVTGMVLPSLRSATSRARSAIGRCAG